MNVFDYLTLIVGIVLIVLVILQPAKDDINDAFNGAKTDLFKVQKARGLELVLKRVTLGVAVLFILFAVLSTVFHLL